MFHLKTKVCLEYFVHDCMKGTSSKKLYLDRGLKYPQQRKCMSRLCLFYKILSTKMPSYIYNLVHPMRISLRHPNTFNIFFCRISYLRNSFSPSVVIECKKLDPNIRDSSSEGIFRNALLKFIRPAASGTCCIINNSIRLKLLTRFRVGFSHLWEHKFQHNSNDTINPLCSCSIETQNIAHYFLRYYLDNDNRTTLMNVLRNVDKSFPVLNDDNLIKLLFHSNDLSVFIKIKVYWSIKNYKDFLNKFSEQQLLWLARWISLKIFSGLFYFLN